MAAQLQFIFGNPVAKHKKSTTIKKKGKPMKKRHKKVRRSKSKKKPNPAYNITLKNKVKYSIPFPGKKQISALEKKIGLLRKEHSQEKEGTKKKRLARAIEVFSQKAKAWKQEGKEAHTAVIAAKKHGAKVKYQPLLKNEKGIQFVRSDEEKMAKKRKKKKAKKVKKVSKKKASPKKRKGKKKSTHKKVKKVSKKRASPKKRKAKKKSHKKVSRKVSRRRARKAAASKRHDKKFVKVHSKAMRTIERIKKGRFKKVKVHGKKYTILRNPLGGAMKKKIEQALGHSTMEAAGLAAGGMLLTALPSVLNKIVPSQYAGHVKKFHLDTIVLPLLIGAAINLKAKSSKVQAIGKGIVGAAVVKASMSATQYAESKLLPSSVAPMQGFVPGPAMGTARLLRKGKGDFGNVSVMRKSKADFGGYTPPPVDFAGDFLDSDMSAKDEENAQMG